MGERGFTLIEMVVAVAIAAILLLGSLWLFGMHAAALRAAVDGFDQRYGEARMLAGKTGNGATIVFAPRSNGGFTMTVYGGRPKDAASVAAMKLDDAPAVLSDATIAGPFGSPPFALFLSSAGRPSGLNGYPSIGSTGVVSFPMVARQPDCPDTANGIVLTFTGANGASDTRKIGCDGMIVAIGTAAPQPSMTPEQLRIDTTSMVAHWTTDSGPLHFKVGEFGYTHWFESAARGTNACGTAQASDTGAAPAHFAPSPYRTGSPAEMSATPAPDANTPYTWAVQEPGHPPDQPPGDFALTPVSGNGGTCTVRIVDDNGQSVNASLQVMGDLRPRNSSMTFASPTAAAQSLTFGKTFDSEQLKLQFGGPCSGIVAVGQIGNAVASGISTQQTTATIAVAPVSAGACVLQVGDQYGEPVAIVNINVKAPQPMATWPTAVKYGANGTDLAGGSSCPAKAYSDVAMTQIDANNTTFASIGVTTDASGCFNGRLVAFEPSGNVSSFRVSSYSCPPGSLTFGSWSPLSPDTAWKLDIAAGDATGSCSVNLQDASNSGKSVPNNGLVTIAVTASYQYQILNTGCGLTQYGNCLTTNSNPPFGTTQYVWYAYAVPTSEGFISVARGPCNDWETPSDGTGKYCAGYDYTIKPSDAVPFCNFSTQSWGPSDQFVGPPTPAGWKWYLSNAGMASAPNGLGLSCSNLVLGNPYYWGYEEASQWLTPDGLPPPSN